MNTQFSPGQIVLPIAVVAGLVMAWFLGLNIANENYRRIAFIIIGCGVIAWSIIGRKIWWLPIFFFVSLGGHFYLGFKIFAHELAVLLCLLPLIVTLAMKRDHFKDRQFSIPLPVFLLFVYLCLHFLACAMNNQVEGIGGMGNVSRRYMDAIWPFLIFMPYLIVGNTKYIRWALHLVAVATLIRFSLGMYTALIAGEEAVLFVPFINFVPAGGFGVGDLRGTGSMLVTLALCYFCIYRSHLLRFVVLLPLITVGIWGTFLGGGRITVVLLFGVFTMLFFVYRRFGLLILAGMSMLIGILALNSEPQVLYHAPESVRRAATAFLFDRDFAADTGATRSSDEWHARLAREGFRSWTSDGLTFLFGRGVRPFEERAWAGGKDFEGMIDMAIATSRFEKGLWDVLCTFGLVGLVLYSVLLVQIIRYCLPILLAEKIRTPVHAIMFIAVYQSVTWFLLCWIAGSFPSSAILFGIVAIVAAHDMKRGRKSEILKAESERLALAGAELKAQT